MKRKSTRIARVFQAKSFKRSVSAMFTMAMMVSALTFSSCIEDDDPSLEWPLPELGDIEAPPGSGETVGPEKNRGQWVTLGASSEWNNEPSNMALNMYDGSLTTVWHTDASGSMPQWFAVDMVEEMTIEGFILTNRQWDQWSPNAIPQSISISISSDGSEWESVVEDEMPDQRGDVPRDAVSFYLETPVKSRYVRVDINSNWGGNGYTYLAEFDIIP